MVPRAGTALEVLLVCVVVAMVAGQAVGQPVLLSYVETGSMEPTLEPGDGFVAIPAQLAGPPEEGDVVVFEAEELHGGGLTTHRIVEETDRGYVTKGDANPFTDQESDEPPVQRPQVVAVVWQPGGDVLVVPGLGAVVTSIRGALEGVQHRLAATFGSRVFLGAQGLAYLVFGLSVIVYAFSWWRDADGPSRRERSRGRDTGIDTRAIVGALAVLIVVAATVAMVAPAGAQEFEVVSSESETSDMRVIERGTSESTEYPVRNSGVLPTVAMFEAGSDGVAIEPREVSIPPRSTTNATLTLTAPPETGYYKLYLVEHRYLAVLPPSVVRDLYAIHPWFPIVAIDAFLGGAFYLFGISLVGTARVRFRRREGSSRTRRLLSRFT